MLKSKFRLKDRRDFRRIYQRGKSKAYPYFILYHFPNSRGTYRIGFSISKKVGKAVVRNRLKRQFREACRYLAKLFDSKSDYIFIVRNAAKEADFWQIANQIEKALINRKGGQLDD